MQQSEINAEMRRAQTDFRAIVATASPANLRRRTNGTRWTNWQLLFHMVLGYLVVRTLMPLVHALGRLGHSRGFATTLMSGEEPQPIVPELLGTVDLVVTLGREAVLEVPPEVELRNWDTDEPSERGIDGIDRMRLIRDDIDARVQALLAELTATTTTPLNS
jgi:hypothetical protein